MFASVPSLYNPKVLASTLVLQFLPSMAILNKFLSYLTTAIFCLVFGTSGKIWSAAAPKSQASDLGLLEQGLTLG